MDPFLSYVIWEVRLIESFQPCASFIVSGNLSLSTLSKLLATSNVAPLTGQRLFYRPAFDLIVGSLVHHDNFKSTLITLGLVASPPSLITFTSFLLGSAFALSTATFARLLLFAYPTASFTFLGFVLRLLPLHLV